MGYSSLVTYRNMTSHMDVGRGPYDICYIALHHTAGVMGVEQCGRVFRNQPVSAHYCVAGNDIGVYVDERNTSWSMGVYSYNQRCVSIEMANSTGAPSWKVSEQTIQTTIKLVADIAHRNGWKTIDYNGNLYGDLIVHRWVAATACPGPYVMNNNIHARIAREANALLQKLRAGASVKSAAYTVAKTAKKATSAYPRPLPTRTLRYGSKGTDVVSWQSFINWYFGKEKPLKVDGDFGPATEKWTIKFQQNYKSLDNDGIVGPQTIKTAKAARK